jgi:hypothetical protein
MVIDLIPYPAYVCRQIQQTQVFSELEKRDLLLFPETVIRMSEIVKIAIALIYRPDCSGIENGACPRIEIRHRQWKCNSIWIFQSNPEAPNVTHE